MSSSTDELFVTVAQKGQQTTQTKTKLKATMKIMLNFILALIPI